MSRKCKTVTLECEAFYLLYLLRYLPILELQNEGLIKRVPRSGTWVAPMDLHFLKQVTEIRVGLESIAGEYAAERITNEQLSELELILDKVSAIETHDNSNHEELLTYESAFHDVIYASTGNPQLEKLLHNYQSVGARFWHYLVFMRKSILLCSPVAVCNSLFSVF